MDSTRSRSPPRSSHKPLADGFLYRSVRNALRYVLGTGADIAVCGMNASEHVRGAAAAICEGPADSAEREEILRSAPELGRYVCRQCGRCSVELMELFRLEGCCDRQMIDYLPHGPADYALRLRLAGWFSLAEVAKERFRASGWDADALVLAASQTDCPYGIDVVRKARLSLMKLRGEPPVFL